MEEKETKKYKCSWCGRESSKMPYAGIREWLGRYFCSERCMKNFEWFNRNGENWMPIKENENGKT